MGLIFYADKNHFCIQAEKRFDEAAIKAFCEQEGLAFYDTAREVRRLKDNASDAFLKVVRPTDVVALLRQIPECKTLVTTGQKATEVIAETFHCQVPPVGGSIQLEIPDLLTVTGPTESAGLAASENLFSGRYPKKHFPEAIANLTRTDASTTNPTQTEITPAGPEAVARLTAEENYFFGRCPKNQFPSANANPSHATAITFWRMPSTSRAYPLPLEKKAEAYRLLFEQTV